MDPALAVKTPISDAIRVPFCHEGCWHRSVSLGDSLAALVLLAALMCAAVQGFESPP